MLNRLEFRQEFTQGISFYAQAFLTHFIIQDGNSYRKTGFLRHFAQLENTFNQEMTKFMNEWECNLKYLL